MYISILNRLNNTWFDKFFYVKLLYRFNSKKYKIIIIKSQILYIPTIIDINWFLNFNLLIYT